MNYNRSATLKQLLAALVCSLGVVILGTVIGWPSPVIKNLERGNPFFLTETEISWMVAMSYMGNMASPIPAGFIMDWIGRRNSLLAFASLPFISWIMVYFSRKGYELYIARFLAGMWNGIVFTIVPLYVAEISEARIRGSLSALLAIATNLGILLVYIVGATVSYGVLALSLAVIPVIFFVGFLFIPESPYWLIMKNKNEAALKSLTWLRGKDYEKIELEFEYIEHCINDEREGRHSFKELLMNSGNRKALIVVLVVVTCQRLSGISVLMAYSSAFPQDGVGKLSQNDSIIVFGCVLLASTFLATFLIDVVGRKPLLIYSSIFCGLAMFLVGLLFYLDDMVLVPRTVYASVVFSAFLLYALMFCLGLGPVSVALQGEMFPSNIKAIASGLTAVFLSLASVITNKMYVPLGNAVGFYLNYWIFAAFCFVAAIFTMLYVIETKGKTLNQIQKELDHRRLTITFH